MYKIKIEHPLIRSGITIEAECTERFLLPTMEKLLQVMRKINQNFESEKPITQITAADGTTVFINK